MKKTTVAVIAGLALGLGASVAAGHPIDSTKKNPGKVRPLAKAMIAPGETPQAEDFFDGFEAYEVGSDIVGQGGWELWYSGGNGALISDDTAKSGEKSLEVTVGSDVVQLFDIDSGVWDFSVWTFMPSDASGDAYVLILNTYGADNTNSWSLQVRFGGNDNLVESQWWFNPDFDRLPLIEDQWVEFSAHIDLGNDTLDMFYNGEVLSTGLQWTGNLGQLGNPPSPTIAAIDLYSSTATEFFYDDVSLKAGVGGCLPDLDGDGVLTLFDFLEFVNLFNAQDPKADWDGDGSFTLFDFLDFVNDFNADC